jgi:hypothetical protein
MDFSSIDEATTQVAVAVHSSVPKIDWREVIVTVLIPPHGESVHSEFAFVLNDGRMDRGLSPVLEGERKVHIAARSHWRLSQKLGQAPWFAMTVRVSRVGKFSTELEYNDNYQEGDLFKARPDPVPSPQ